MCFDFVGLHVFGLFFVNPIAVRSDTDGSTIQKYEIIRHNNELEPQVWHSIIENFGHRIELCL